MVGTEVKRDRSELEHNLITLLSEIKNDKVVVKKIKEGMKKHRILAGTVQEWVNNSKDEISNLNDDKLFLFTEQVFEVTGNSSIYPANYFTDRQKKEIKTTFEGYQTEEIKFPYTFKRQAEEAEDAWYILVSVTELRLLNNGKEIQYNPNTQRSSRVKQIDDNTVIPVPKLYQKSVGDIESLFLQNKLKSSQLTFNARLGSSEDNEEVIYNKDTKELTISKGTLFDCLDGFHRLTATIRGQEKNPNMDMHFMLKIINTTEPEAKREFTQINTVNVVTKAQRDKMDQEKFENFIVGYLEKNSEIKDKIISENVVNPKSDKLVSYSVLSDAIKDNFEIKTKGEAIKIGQYLTEFFNEICYNYPDEFLGDVVSVKEKSIINSNVTFYGYVILAKRFLDEKIPVSNIVSIIDNIDFGRDNEMWKNLDVTDNKGRNSRSARKGIKQFFSELKLK